MYTKFVNDKLLNMHENIREQTRLLESFFNHISDLSYTLKEMLNSATNDEPIEKHINNLYLLNPKKKYNISFVIICKNEERCIARCIEHIAQEIGADDEIIIVDSGSSDDTLNIIAKYKFVKVHRTQWKEDFSDLRNRGAIYAKNDWIFFIDADEVLVEDSIKFLKSYLNVIDWYGFSNVVCAPALINENGQAFKGLRRIIKKSSGVKFYGKIHEEPRLEPSLLATDISNISFDNVTLLHDGYNKDIVREKRKVERNVHMLVDAIGIEPQHPRWKYFYCRDGKSVISKEEYEKVLIEVIEISNEENSFKFYKVRAISNLVGFYCEGGNLMAARIFLTKLKEICPELSDTIYYDVLIEIGSMKNTTLSLLNDLCKFRKSCSNLEYGGINSNFYHIDYLIAVAFFEIGEYKKCFSILKKLESINFGDYSKRYQELHQALLMYFASNKK